MMLFLDSSAAVKLYITEPGSELVREQTEAAGQVFVAMVTYAEVRAAFAGLRRLQRLGIAAYRQTKLAWERDWTRFLRLPLSEAVCREAGQMAEDYGLRGYGSVQLAAFASLVRNAAAEVQFCSFDSELSAAAVAWQAKQPRR